MSCKRNRFAGVVIAAVFGLSTASAGEIYFTASGTGTLNYSSWNILTGSFGFFYDYFDVSDTCPGGSCVSASTLGGTPLGNFGLSIAGNYYFSNVGNGTPGAELTPPAFITRLSYHLAAAAMDLQ